MTFDGRRRLLTLSSVRLRSQVPLQEPNPRHRQWRLPRSSQTGTTVSHHRQHHHVPIKSRRCLRKTGDSHAHTHTHTHTHKQTLTSEKKEGDCHLSVFASSPSMAARSVDSIPSFHVAADANHRLGLIGRRRVVSRSFSFSIPSDG